MLPTILLVLLVFLCGQRTFGQAQINVEGLHVVNVTEHFTDSTNKVAFGGHPSAGYTDRGSYVVRAEQPRLPSSRALAIPADRNLRAQQKCLNACVRLTGCGNGNVTLELYLDVHAAPVGDVEGERLIIFPLGNVTFVNGKTDISIDIEDAIILNAAQNATCDGCVFKFIDINKICENGIFTRETASVEVKGDPHMVGLLGQKIDWAGEDNMWYCLLSDGPEFHINVRLSAPMKEEFPNRQLVSAVSLLTNDGHSLVVEVIDPYNTDTAGCPEKRGAPCLAEGGVRIIVDGVVSDAMQSPADNVPLPGGVVVSVANLLPECRPFGGDRIWAAQFEQMTAGRRSLRGNMPLLSFNEWILKGDTLAAPTWCAKLLDESGPSGLLSASSNHVTIRIDTVTATIRVNVGVNYQDEKIGSDGIVLVPELEFWQTDIEFDMLHYSETVTGLLGDTSRFVLDVEGFPVTTGLEALHAPVESYRVDGPYDRVFDKIHL